MFDLPNMDEIFTVGLQFLVIPIQEVIAESSCTTHASIISC
jgi:hypothetical protein